MSSISSSSEQRDQDVPREHLQARIYGRVVALAVRVLGSADEPIQSPAPLDRANGNYHALARGPNGDRMRLIASPSTWDCAPNLQYRLPCRPRRLNGELALAVYDA